VGDRYSDSNVIIAARGGSAVFAGKLFAWGTRFVLAVFLARILGAADYGLYNLALTVAAVAASFPTLGLDAALVRYTAVFAGRKDSGSVLGTLQLGIGVPAVLSIAFAAGVILLAEPIASGVMHDTRLAPLLVISSLLIPATVLNRQLAATLQGFKRIEYDVLAEQFGQPLIRFALLVIFALLGLTAAYAVLASLLSAVAATALLLLIVNRLFPLRGTNVTAKREPRQLIGFSLPVFFSNVISTFGSNLQTLFLGAMSTIASVGVFAVANQVNLVGSIFQSSVVASSLPLFAESEDRGDRRALERLYQTTSKWSFSLNLPFFLMVIAFPQALLAIFGSEFEAGEVALIILAWANLVNAATGTSGAVLDMTGHTRVKLLNSTVAVGLGVGLSFLLIPSQGLVGAAISAFASQSAVNILRLVEVALLVKASPYNRTYLKPLAAAAVAWTSAIAIGWVTADMGAAPELLAGVTTLFGVYAAALVVLGVDPEDRLVLDRIKGRLLRRGRLGRPAKERPAPEPGASGRG
jgi:O-antigen/teichoic acid export membrane protein